MTKYRMLGKRILVRRDPPDESGGMILLPDEVRKPPRWATVEAIGPEVNNVKVGDRVAIHEYSGVYLEVSDLASVENSSDLIVLQDHEEILAVKED